MVPIKYLSTRLESVRCLGVGACICWERDPAGFDSSGLVDLLQHGIRSAEQGLMLDISRRHRERSTDRIGFAQAILGKKRAYISRLVYLDAARGTHDIPTYERPKLSKERYVEARLKLLRHCFKEADIVRSESHVINDYGDEDKIGVLLIHVQPGVKVGCAEAPIN